MRTLSGRVTLIVTLAVAAVLVVVGAVLVAELGRRERATFNRELRAAAARAEQPARRALGAAGLPAQERALQRAAGDFSLRLVRRGEVVHDDLRAYEVPIPARTGASTVTSGTGERWRVIVRTVRPRSEGRLVVAGSLSRVEERVDELRRTIALAFALGLLACALAVRLLTALTLRPLGRLREGAAAVTTTRDLTTRVPAAGAEEVDEVAGAMNAMLARLEQSAAATERALEASRRFTADAGHELRTPLTSVRANLAALRHGPDERVLDDLERDLARLTALLDGLQALARGDAGARHPEPVNVADLADAALADARRRHPGADFAFAEAVDVTIQGDEAGVRAALDNLLENAARHGARTVRVTVARGEAATVLVDDDGPGIPAGERERVFERFARAAGATAPGSGLGLAIVAQQARLHGGTVAIADSPLGGTRFVLELGTMRG